MTHELIRTQQRWLPRAIDVVLTLLAWAGFAYLFFTGFIAVLQKRPPVNAHIHFVFLWATIDTLFIYLLIGGLNAAILALWAQYNQIRRRVERRSPVPALEDVDLAATFHLLPEMLQLLRSNAVVTIHNDDHGNITAIDVGSVVKLVVMSPLDIG